MNIQTIRTSSKKTNKIDRYGDMAYTIAYTVYDPNTDVYTITLTYKASTKTRLHEIAHCLLGHLPIKPRMTVSDFITKELEAEAWAYQACSKPLSLDSVINIAYLAIIGGARSNSAFNTSLNILARYNYRLTREQRSHLWEMCREFERDRKAIG